MVLPLPPRAGAHLNGFFTDKPCEDARLAGGGGAPGGLDALAPAGDSALVGVTATDLDEAGVTAGGSA